MRLHLLSVSPRALRNKCFVIQKRGEIEVKGKGRMTTYFLERNTAVSEQQIMGLRDGWEDSQRSCQPGLHRTGLFIVRQLVLLRVCVCQFSFLLAYILCCRFPEAAQGRTSLDPYGLQRRPERAAAIVAHVPDLPAANQALRLGELRKPAHRQSIRGPSFGSAERCT